MILKAFVDLAGKWQTNMYPEDAGVKRSGSTPTGRVNQGEISKMMS
jgi:hypothetical protein